ARSPTAPIPARPRVARLLLPDLLAVWASLVDGLTATVDADFLRDGHEDRVVERPAAQAFHLSFLGRLLLQEQQGGEDVDARLNDERLNGQIDASKHPAVLHDPPSDAFIAEIAEQSVG